MRSIKKNLIDMEGGVTKGHNKRKLRRDKRYIQDLDKKWIHNPLTDSKIPPNIE